MPKEPAAALVRADRLHDLDYAGLSSALAALFEDAGPLVDALCSIHFNSWDELLIAAERAIEAMNDTTRADLLKAHPRIGTPASILATRKTSSSFHEQGGLAPISDEVAARLQSLNDAYESRFGFPFVEWVAGRTKAEMIPILESRLENDRAAELDAGTRALVAIARDRLAYFRRSEP